MTYLAIYLVIAMLTSAVLLPWSRRRLLAMPDEVIDPGLRESTRNVSTWQLILNGALWPTIVIVGVIVGVIAMVRSLRASR